MNKKLFLATLLSFILSAIPVWADTAQEITLTVSSDGPNKEEATKNALREAIEQAYGAFVSANTTILNDEVVKDEIVTLSNGSIKEYKEISAIPGDNDRYFVTLSATVSLPHLITYARSHGSECEFAGNTFGMEMKLYELQKENERKALENLLSQLEQLIPATMSWTIELSEPVVKGDYYEIKAIIKWLDQNFDYNKWLLAEANLPEEAMEWTKDYNAIWKKYKKQYNGNREKFREDYRKAQDIQREREYVKKRGNKIFNEFTKFLHDNLSAISLTKEGNETLEKRGVETGKIYLGLLIDDERARDLFPTSVRSDFLLRSDDNARFFRSKLDELIVKSALNFVIKDNTGQASDPMLLTPREINEYSNFYNKTYYKEEASPVYKRATYLDHNYYIGELIGTGIFKDGFKFKYPGERHTGSNNFVSWGKASRHSEKIMDISFKIPKEDIGKYSKFWIEPKQ